MHLLDLGAVATVAIALLLLAGLLWGAREAREARRARVVWATYEALRPTRTLEYARMSQRLGRFPARVDVREAEAMDEEAREALSYFVLQFETLGLLARRGALDAGLLRDAVGRDVARFWSKVQPYVEERRRALGSPEICRWTEWLAGEIEAAEAFEPEGPKA